MQSVTLFLIRFNRFYKITVNRRSKYFALRLLDVADMAPQIPARVIQKYGSLEFE